jgi:hypothetical protein
MPEIARFLGIKIIMWFNDHGDPHFHARYGKHTAKFRIRDAALLDGQLPPRVTALIVEWTLLNQAALFEDWNQVRQGRKPARIKGLE